MVKSLGKLKSLKGRSLDELRVRSWQALAAYTERRGWSEQARTPSDAAFFKLLDRARIEGSAVSAESLLEHLRGRRCAPPFFASFADPTATLAELRRRWPQGEAKVIEKAELIIEGKIDLLGLRALTFGDPPDWHLEPVSGKRAPLAHWSRIDYLSAEVAGDKKIVWELNRHQHFMALGRAYFFERDERYAQTFAAHIDSWIRENPPKLGINWASSLEVAFRSISWLWAIHFFKDSSHLTAPLFLRILKSLYIHARHLETYLSTYFSPNTHLTGEALGLFYLGTLLPEFRRAKLWRDVGRHILLTQLPRHVRPDGVYFEQSSYYHRYTTDFYMHLYILGQANGESFADAVHEKLTALLDHLMYIARPDGTTPFFGDDDGGRLVMLDERAPNDFRAALATGAALFRRPDYKYAAGEAGEETLWMLGSEGLRAFDDTPARPPLQASRAFTGGGYYVMRDGWRDTANYLLIDCGPHGTLNCGHAHADALAFEIAACGQTMLVDPGTYTYTGAAKMRDWFRTSAAHNTLTVDAKSSSVPDGPFTWKHVARSRERVWTSVERFDYFEGEHDGYMRLDAPVAHMRSVLFLKNDYWIIRDRVASSEAHRYDLHFHFAAGIHLAMNTDADTGSAIPALVARRESAGHAPGLEIFAFGKDGQWREEQGWVSHCYGERCAAPVFSFSVETVASTQDIVTFLIPHGAEQTKARVRELEAQGGCAFEVLNRSTRDAMLIGSKSCGSITTARFTSDFESAWIRFADTGALREFVLLRGQQLYLDGCEIFKASSFVGYAFVRCENEELRIEIDASAVFTVNACERVRRAVINDQSFSVESDGVLSFANGRLQNSAKTRAVVEALG